nr:PLP-dependent aspartate aminotransferase family protein [Candidatus Njordarchaeota archaeon]
MKFEESRFNTKAVHSGEAPDPTTHAHRVPIYQTSTFVYENPDQLVRGRYFYTRTSNPTIDALEEKVAALEGGEAALATASGMAAISISILSNLKRDDTILCSAMVYGGTHDLLTKTLPPIGFKTQFVDFTDLNQVNKAMKELKPRIVYFESPTNPTLRVMDIEAISKMAREAGAVSIFDNTFASPYIQQPIKLGVDIVASSATKYLSGHGDTLAGVIIGKKPYILNTRFIWAENLGPTLSPFNAWLILRGTRTLGPRMEQHCGNAMKVALHLEKHPKVKKVNYPGLQSHPQHNLAKKQMKLFGGMLSFELADPATAQKMLSNLKLCGLGVSLGDTDTLVEWPAYMSHLNVPKKERLKVGVPDELVRLSVGLEDAEDIIADLDQALAKAA